MTLSIFSQPVRSIISNLYVFNEYTNVSNESEIILAYYKCKLATEKDIFYNNVEYSIDSNFKACRKSLQAIYYYY